jgi:hypothetical protein
MTDFCFRVKAEARSPDWRATGFRSEGPPSYALARGTGALDSAMLVKSGREPHSLNNPCVVARNESGHLSDSGRRTLCRGTSLVPIASLLSRYTSRWLPTTDRA